jgi:hypothetical protein
VLDHLVYHAPDLDEAVADLEARLGVRPAAGGRHPGRGTRNALLALGDRAYLEVLAPDPDQPPPERSPSAWSIGPQPRLATWAVRTPVIEMQAALALGRGVDLGAVVDMSRERPDGALLRWRLTAARMLVDGLVPFLIDWGDSPHPSESAPDGCTLVELWGEHPEPARVGLALDAAGVSLRVERGPAPALVALLDTPRGRVELR